MSEKINELVLMAKEHIHLGEKESEQSIREIQNEIDDKNLEIRDIFSRNIQSVLAHYIKYQEIVSNQKRLDNYCEEFSRRIEKTQNLSQYDENMIERSQKTIQALRKKKNEIDQYRDCVNKLKKAALYIEEQKYNNAIKLLNSYNDNQPPGETPLNKSAAIFREKIKGHLLRLTQSFWDTNKNKIVDIGSLCYNKVELSTHEKTNIYQAFFGRNSAARNSLIRRSSMRTSVIEEGKNDAPLRFLKKVKEEEILQKYLLRLNIDMNSLKQMRILCNEMKEETLFQKLIHEQIIKFIQLLAEETSCDNENDLKKILSLYIGVLLYRREIIAFFNLDDESKIVYGHVYSMIGKQAKNLVNRPENLGQILNVKNQLDIFYKVLEIIYLDKQASQFSLVLGEIFKIYCNYSLDQYELVLAEQINEDNLTLFGPEDPYQEQLILEVLKVKPDHVGKYNFTLFVAYVLQLFNQFFDRMVAFVKDSQLNKSQLHDHMSSLLEKIIVLYGGHLVISDQPLQIAQGQINLLFCEKIWLYFSQQLEVKYEYIRTSEPKYRGKMEQKLVQMRRRMREVVEDKIIQIMCSYEADYVWLPQNVNNGPNEFVQWMLEFLKQMILNLRKINNPAHQQMAYSWFGYIANCYWEYFETNRQFTLITIYNLDLDLLSIFKFISRSLGFYPNLADKFRSLSQFYSLMLTNNINDILEKPKRDISYAHIDFQRLIPILKRYNKAKSNCGGKIRDLKKKDVDAVVRRLEMDLAYPQ